MKAEGKVQVVVRSRRVPVGTFSYSTPFYSASGVLVGSQPHRSVLYGISLDEENRRTIEEAQKLASNLGMGLEVIDESTSGFLSRFLSRLGGNDRSPAVLVPSLPSIAAPDPSQGLPHGC